MIRTSLFAFAAILGVATVHAADTDPYQRSIEQWRADRVARLTAPDGWLSLVGLEWLKPGANRLGSASGNDIVLAGAPAYLGTLTLAGDGAMQLRLADGSGATVDGKAVHETALVDDQHASGQETPTTVAFGSSAFHVIDRDGRKALRVRNSQAPTRQHFAGLDYFPIDPDWRVVADWVPFVPAQQLQIGSVIGTIDSVEVPGKAVFQRDGHTYELLPYQEEPGGELFFVMADRTSGKETYGAARFLYAALPDGGLARPGHVVLDFNRLYNPPCAFTPFATCPLAPPENRLDLRVTAGEKKYRGGHA